MSAARKICEDIEGAPLKIGQRVRVLAPCDEAGYPDLTGLLGTVAYFEYECGCGQTFPGDPMIGVDLENGDSHEFWKEELEAVSTIACRTEAPA